MENMIEIVVVKFDGQNAQIIRKIRNAVFTKEQHIDENIDFDGQDDESVHVLINFEGKYVGTGRMLEEGHIVDGGLDTQNDAELVVHLDGNRSHLMLDAAAQQADIEAIAHIALVVAM